MDTAVELRVSPEKIEANIAPKEEVTQSFCLKNYGAVKCQVSLGVGALPPGTNIFVHQTMIAIKSKEKVGVSFTIELEPHMAQRRVLEIIPLLKRSGNDYKCILTTTFKEIEDDATQAGKPGSQYINVILIALNPSTPKLSFTLKKNTSLGRLKQIYMERANIPATRVRFIYYGRQLEDGKTPGDYDMENNSSIHVVECLCGC